MVIDSGGEADCSGLDGFKSFESYASLLRDRTSFNETLLSQCRLPICQALWGFGEPDLSGIGVAIGYMLSSFIGTVLSPLLFVVSSHLGPTALSITTAGISSFFDSAAYFAFAIQIATIATLASKDFETKTTSFGDYEVTIAGVVSVLCLIPLIPPLILLSAATPSIRTRRTYRLLLFALAVTPSTGPFLEQSIRNFGPSEIGEGKGDGGKTYVTDKEWGAINTLCFGGIVYTTDNEDYILSIFQMAGSLFVFLFTVGFSIPTILQQIRYVFGEENPFQQRFGGWVDWASGICWLRAMRWALLGLPFCLAVPLLWGFWRLRGLQAQLSASMGAEYRADEWGFGQVMAITVFVPVAAEMVFVGVLRRLDFEEEEREEDGRLGYNRPDIEGSRDNRGDMIWMGDGKRAQTAPQ